MSDRLLRLHFSQLEKAWESSVNNSYSDVLKERHHAFLEEIFQKLSAFFVDSKANQEAKQHVLKAAIDYVFKNIDYLDSSTLTIMPFELVKCLEFALSDWCRDDEKLLILTKESHMMEDFLFDHSFFNNGPTKSSLRYLKIEEESLKNAFNPVLIAFPKYLINDYLGSVALYHELGHYIDFRFNISIKVYNEIFNRLEKGILQPSEIEEIEAWFPDLRDAEIRNKTIELFKDQKRNELLLRQLQEYFADLFAAQYVADCLVEYLAYVVDDNEEYSPHYPTLSNRQKIIRVFLTGENSFLLELLNGALVETTRNEIGRIESLKIRYKEINYEDIYQLLPVEIDDNDPSCLHYLFIAGWCIWKGDWLKFKTLNGFKFELNDSQVAQITNNLIEKSISNFLVKQNWNKAKKI